MHHKRIKAAHTVTITDIRKHEPLVSRTNKKIHLRDNSISSRNCCAKTGEAMLYCRHLIHVDYFHPLKPNDPYSGRTAPLTSESCILYIQSRNTGTEYFKHGIYSPFFFSSKCSLFHNYNVFGSFIIHILYTVCAKIKKNNSGAKRLTL